VDIRSGQRLAWENKKAKPNDVLHGLRLGRHSAAPARRCSGSGVASPMKMTRRSSRPDCEGKRSYQVLGRQDAARRADLGTYRAWPLANRSMPVAS